MPPKIIHDERLVVEEIFERRRKGMSIRDIAKATGVSKSTVHRILNGLRACDRGFNGL